MAMASEAMRTTKAWTWTLLFLAFCSNLLYMAGLAALQYACNYNFFGPVVSAVRPPAAFGLSDTFENCGTVFRFYWFSWAFTTVVLLGLGVATATRLGLHYTCGFWIGMIAVCIYINMVTCEAFLGYEKIYSVGSYWWLARWRAVVAGAIINVIWLIFLLMAVGTDWERGGGHSEEIRPAHQPDAKMAGVSPMPGAMPVAERV